MPRCVLCKARSSACRLRDGAVPLLEHVEGTDSVEGDNDFVAPVNEAADTVWCPHERAHVHHGHAPLPLALRVRVRGRRRVVDAAVLAVVVPVVLVVVATAKPLVGPVAVVVFASAVASAIVVAGTLTPFTSVRVVLLVVVVVVMVVVVAVSALVLVLVLFNRPVLERAPGSSGIVATVHADGLDLGLEVGNLVLEVCGRQCL